MKNQEFKSTRVQYRELLDRYIAINDELMEYTDHYHDNLYFDIEGYWSYFLEGDYENIEELREQVAACELLLEANKKLCFRYC